MTAVMGMGLPLYRRGIIFWADFPGSKYICSSLEWSKMYGQFFKPCAYLAERAAKGAYLSDRRFFFILAGIGDHLPLIFVVTLTVRSVTFRCFGWGLGFWFSRPRILVGGFLVAASVASVVQSWHKRAHFQGLVPLGCFST
ncbi:hypothetical protein NE237_002150 [Protea cynaroides]|uniref:Uncharacterized protein n=1 Tax=Protea cynaroides TaxID=273540 RepID=A0A9Q0KUW4_9MAGN|nr:hypothetical protein NE237_002150 [Protea cynaroides]